MTDNNPSVGFGGKESPTDEAFVDGFSPAQVEELGKKLDIRNVKDRVGGGGMRLSYIEGWFAIKEANRIFGFGQWDRRLEELTMTSEIEEDHGSGKRWRVSYLAKVQIFVQVPAAKESIVREGIGAGHGISRNPGEAHEAAAKEAETDAMKRALMTFGNSFGLALYDKDQADVEYEVFEYDLPAPKEGGSTDEVAAWVISQGGRIEGNKVRSVKRIEALERQKAERASAVEAWNDGKAKEMRDIHNRSIEMNPDVLREDVNDA